MNKQELIDYCNALKENKSQIINCIDVNGIIKRIEQLDEPQKVTIPQFVADWYEENKDVFEANLYRCVYNIQSVFGSDKLNEFERWFLTASTKTFQTLVNMHQFGYTVEEEKQYLVKVKGLCGNHETLNCEKHSKDWLFSSQEENSLYKTKHTRKELEESGFGWVFDCEGIEVKEVE